MIATAGTGDAETDSQRLLDRQLVGFRLCGRSIHLLNRLLDDGRRRLPMGNLHGVSLRGQRLVPQMEQHTSCRPIEKRTQGSHETHASCSHCHTHLLLPERRLRRLFYPPALPCRRRRGSPRAAPCRQTRASGRGRCRGCRIGAAVSARAGDDRAPRRLPGRGQAQAVAPLAVALSSRSPVCVEVISSTASSERYRLPRNVPPLRIIWPKRRRQSPSRRVRRRASADACGRSADISAARWWFLPGRLVGASGL